MKFESREAKENAKKLFSVARAAWPTMQLGVADIGQRLVERLVDGILHSFQEQSVEDIVMLNGFGTVVNALGARYEPYLPQIRRRRAVM
ncbi:hypothetical protein B0T24DRAFT_683229 [Lasiosphaeria ovina]|uniref:Uncharacterized protein n=1 Tax=Lasiosphaeria ovina TaxID=92902 RepID=A0AAE0N0H6_9PEZI|nr:hypothetical protein B0T24DRAFT_683229 [Lasiosphaeria ovina]